MADINVTNLFDLSYDQINTMKKKDLVNHIKRLKGKITVEATIKKLCNEISQLSTSVNKLMTENGKISSQMMIVSTANILLVTCVTELEKQQSKVKQYSRRNNVEISDISNEVSDESLEKKVIDICKESGIHLNPYDIVACHRLPPGCVNKSNCKHVIVKFINRKHSEAMLHLKKSINSCSNVCIMNSLCPYYRFLWGKCKDLQRKDLINQVFRLGTVVTIKVRENGPPIKIFPESDLLVHQDMSTVVPGN